LFDFIWINLSISFILKLTIVLSCKQKVYHCKLKQNNGKYLSLRKEYPFFEFQKYSFQVKKQALEVEFNFNISGIYFFKPVIHVPARSYYHWENLKRSDLENLVFHLGMIELISYWKATCSQRVIIRPNKLDEKQINWWKKLYFNGLGEFFYLNGIDADFKNFMEIISEGEAPKPINTSLEDKKIIVPVGGGKDSVVTIELLKESQQEIVPMALNPRAAIKRTIASAGFVLDHSIVVNRKIDPLLLKLNDEGYLNGHTPFSALLAFVNLLVAVGSGINQVALSNESSASQSTIPGTKINHQYSKSIEFEEDFRLYVKAYIHPELNYFSFLRPLNELQIAKLFSQYPRHFNGFRSCNAGSKVDEWCGECPKCLFTEIILAPFLSDKKRFDIFRKNILDDPHLEPVFDELTGNANIKPFECVGTPDEVKVALTKYAGLINPDRYPYLLKKYLDNGRGGKEEHEYNLLIHHFNDHHFVPSYLVKLLNEKIDFKIHDFQEFLRNEFSGISQILILGSGREGRSTFQLIRKYLPDIELSIADRDEKIQIEPFDDSSKVLFYTGDNYLDALNYFRLAIKSPGIKLSEDSRDDECQVTSQTELFLEFYRDQVIGVTGTKGKSTTASLIYHLLNEAGKEVLLLGNIGVPAFDLVEKIAKNTTVVFELSAHQLQNIEVSPHIAVLLNIYPEHLDHFGSITSYHDAKMNIAMFQKPGDKLIVPEGLYGSIPQSCESEKIIINDASVAAITEELDFSRIKLKGVHNQFNIAVATATAQLFNIGIKQLINSIYSFESLPHRLEYVGNFGDVDFYNDSISTIPESTIAAVRAIPAVRTLILGGFDRGLDYSQLVKYLKTTTIRNFIFLGIAGEKMLSFFKNNPNPDQYLYKVSSLEEAFPIIVENTPKDSVCLLSPAAASYDQFHNFEHRGSHFKQLAMNIKKGGNSRLSE